MSSQPKLPMPKGPANMSKEEIAFVKKKVSAPVGPPPNIKTFNAPKVNKIPSSKSFTTRRYDDEEDDDEEDEKKADSSDDESDTNSVEASNEVIIREKMSMERSIIYSDEKSPSKTSKRATVEELPDADDPLPPSSDAVFNFRPLLKATYRVLREFVMNPAEKGVLTRCYIERSLKATEMFVPRYSLCADLEDGTGRELIVCRKIISSRTAHYVFSLKDEDLYKARDKRSRLYLGKLRATPHNTLAGGSSAEYVLYDSGTVEHGEYGEVDESDDADLDGSRVTEEDSLYRRELAAIVMHQRLRPVAAGVRALEVCIPSAARSGGNRLYHLSKPFKTAMLDKSQNDGSQHKITVLHERVSRYDPLSACLVDFKGRANVASIKNFQLVLSYPSSGVWDEERESQVSFVLQMAKTTGNCFNMDYKAPLSMLQAFAICVARLDANLAWEK